MIVLVAGKIDHPKMDFHHFNAGKGMAGLFLRREKILKLIYL